MIELTNPRPAQPHPVIVPGSNENPLLLVWTSAPLASIFPRALSSYFSWN
jgi:hypothetical protein